MNWMRALLDGRIALSAGSSFNDKKWWEVQLVGVVSQRIACTLTHHANGAQRRNEEPRKEEWTRKPFRAQSAYGVRFSRSEVDLDLALGEHLAGERREGDEDLVQLAVDLRVVLRATG